MNIKYHIICPNCGHEFNIDYSEWNSLSDPEVGIIFRYGSNTFSCKCPIQILIFALTVTFYDFDFIQAALSF